MRNRSSGRGVAEYAIRRNTRHPDAFDIRIIHTADYPFLKERDGEKFGRDRMMRTWRYDDLQSFTPLRFLPPQLMGYSGRALVIDPDIFAVADVWDLLSRNMNGAAILCRLREKPKGFYGYYASSVMLLDCARLRHWQLEQQFNELFEFKRDYMDWISLKLEPKESIGLFEKEWNDFDRLNAKTKMLHNTRRITQPWKTGLPIDFTPPDSFSPIPIVAWVMKIGRHVIGRNGLISRYLRHPDIRKNASSSICCARRWRVERSTRHCSALRWRPTTSATMRSR
ncbi:MAG: hypothetical protein HC834_08625 [Rhodospirillales bacterium]|nr:hypothetical protein [Rhodospirillales bacterium]